MRVDLTLLKRIHESISTGATGNPNKFAEKLCISRRLLLEILKKMKEEFDAPIGYCRHRETYYYTEECTFYFGIVKSRKAIFTHTLLTAISNTIVETISKSVITLILVGFI